MTINQFAQNLVWASPAAATGAPAMRALVAADIPTTLAATTFTGNVSVDLNNPSLTLTDLTNVVQLGLATTAGAFFTDTAAGDAIIRSTTGVVRIGHGSGTASTVQISASGETDTGTLTVGGKSVLVDQAGWSAWTPTITAATGTLTTTSVPEAQYQQLGRFVYFRLQINITTNGTGGGAVLFTLPVTALDGVWVGQGRENATTGKMLQVLGSGTTQATIYNYDNSYPGGSGYHLICSGFYEAATG